jgi:hypothetical protein
MPAAGGRRPINVLGQSSVQGASFPRPRSSSGQPRVGPAARALEPFGRRAGAAAAGAGRARQRGEGGGVVVPAAAGALGVAQEGPRRHAGEPETLPAQVGLVGVAGLRGEQGDSASVGARPCAIACWASARKRWKRSVRCSAFGREADRGLAAPAQLPLGDVQRGRERADAVHLPAELPHGLRHHRVGHGRAADAGGDLALQGCERRLGRRIGFGSVDRPARSSTAPSRTDCSWAGPQPLRAPSTRGPQGAACWTTGRRQLSTAGGTSSGTDGGGATVWIPLSSGSSTGWY